VSLAKKIHLREGEEIIAIVRRYLLVYLWRYFLGLAILFLTAFFMFWLFSRGWWGEVLFGLGIFIGLLIIFSTWFFRRHNILAVTTERVVDVQRSGWFDEEISSIGFLEIKDIAVRKHGVLAMIFNYGQLTILPKSQQFVLEVDALYRPQRLQSLLLEKSQIYRSNRRVATAETIYNNFLKIIPELSDQELEKVLALTTEQLEINDEAGGES